jgi:hypothetical protein
MAMSGFICHDDYLSKTAKLSDEEVGRLFRALMEYHATGTEKEITGRESIAFDFIREDIDRTERAYKAKCDKNRENRLSAIDNNRQRSSTSVDVPAQKEKEKDIYKEKNKKDIDPQKRFTPPTVEEVAEYCKERNNNVNPQKFVDFYTAKGWKIGKESMKDWKASVRTWENRDGGKKVIAQNFPQRDYSDVNEQIMSDLADEMDAFRRGAG